MKNKEHLVSALKSVKLSSDARARIRAELANYADFYAVPASAPLFKRMPRLPLGRFPYALVASAVLLLGGGVAYAAHGALPGDPLYPVKVALLEPAEKTFRPQTPTDWSITLVHRRLDEADRVASTTPSSKREARAALEVARAAQKVQVNLEALPTASKAQATAAFNETLSAHERTLARLTTVATSTNAATGTASVLEKLFTETRTRVEKEPPTHSTSTRERARTPERKPARVKGKATSTVPALLPDFNPAYGIIIVI